MKLQNMFGVVLWSDATAQKAVIWCEDQGELAFYTPDDDSKHQAPELDAGDLIQFDLSVQHNVRKACNPRLLMQSHSPDLPNQLQAEHKAVAEASACTSAPAGDEKVVDLSRFFTSGNERKLACSG